MTPDVYAKIALWSEVLGGVAFFAVIFWLWRRFITPAIIAATERKNSELLEGERKRDAARQEVSAAQRRFEEAQTQVAAIVERGRLDGQREGERIVADAREDAERTIRNADGELGRGRVAAREQYRDELLEEALRIVRERASKEIDAQTNSRIVERAMDSLDGNAA